MKKGCPFGQPLFDLGFGIWDLGFGIADWLISSKIPDPKSQIDPYSPAGRNIDLFIAASLPTTANRMCFIYLFDTIRMSAGVTARTPFKNSNEFRQPPPINS